MYLTDKRPHAYHRKKLIRQLVADGYKLEKAPKIERKEPYALYNGPRPDDWFFRIDLKRFHAGEALEKLEKVNSPKPTPSPKRANVSTIICCAAMSSSTAASAARNMESASSSTIRISRPIPYV